MEILSPTTEARAGGDTGYLVERLPELSGRRLVALWNGRRPGPGREFLTAVLQTLDERHGLASWEVERKPYLGNPAPTELIKKIVRSGAHGVITGLGD